jgi:hypothetical protein
MKNEVKLIAFDLDSTLLYNGKFPNHDDLAMIQKLQAKGYLITLATGQSFNTASKYAKDLKIDQYLNEIICHNGAYRSRVDKFVPENVQTIDPKIVAGLVDYFQEHHFEAIFLKYNEFDNFYYLNYQVEALQAYLGSKLNYLPLTKKTSLKGISFIWLRLPLHEDEKLLAKIEKLYPQKLSLTSSYSDDMSLMEVMISDARGTKGEQLLALSKELKVNPNELLTFGDGGNDVPMFVVAKYSVAMGNAKDQVKQAASYVTDTCLNAGVSKFLKKYF